jgi:S1-C subfamily serine protease
MFARLLAIALVVAACSGRSERPVDDKPAPNPDGFIGIRYVWYDGHAEIDSIVPETPAERAGLRAGDVIATIDGRTPESADEVQQLIIRSRVGTAATLGVLRDGELLSMRVRVTTWPTQLDNARPDFARSELDRRLPPPRPLDD